MAGLRAGAFSVPPCGECYKDETLKKLNGCHGHTASRPRSVMVDNKIYKLMNCPNLFVNKWVKTFVSIYDTMKLFGNKSDPFALPLKFINATIFFDNTLTELSSQKNVG